MQLLKKMADRMTLQVLCDALEQQGIDFRVDGREMHALLPLPGIFDARVMVAERDWHAARQVLSDLGLDTDGA